MKGVVLRTWLVFVGVAVVVAGLMIWFMVGVRVVIVGLLVILISSRANNPFIPRCPCISCRTLVVLLVVGDSGLKRRNKA